MILKEVMQLLEELAPVSYAEDWDNVGLLVGDEQKEIRRIMLAVDPTENVIDQAVAMHADLLLTHHPLIFNGVKRVTAKDFVGRRILKLCQADICLYAMHTNFDVMGMADAAADEMHLKNSEVLDVTYEDEISKEGIGRIGYLEREMTLRECAEICKQSFLIDHVRVYGSFNETVERVAVVPGSGKDFIPVAIEKGADVLITGDIGHHNGIDAMEQGLSVIDAGHYGLEKIFVPYMETAILRELPQMKVIRASESAPFYIL